MAGGVESAIGDFGKEPNGGLIGLPGSPRHCHTIVAGEDFLGASGKLVA